MLFLQIDGYPDIKKKNSPKCNAVKIMGERPGKQSQKTFTSLIAFSLSEAQTRHTSFHFAESQIR